MMTDPASHRLSRSIRPSQSPMGPRTRGPRPQASGSLSSSSSNRDSCTSASSDASPAYPLSPARSDVPLPSISEYGPSDPLSTPPTPEIIPSSPPAFKPIPKQATLAPAPTLNFDSIPVQWKGLPLDAALWTFSSQELQDLVSRAIRSSARESFIRLLSAENVDHTLPDEIERLTFLKSMTQSKYRFQVKRRTMLLQALNSSSGVPDRNTDGTSVISQLTLQLSQTTGECDVLLEELLRITDQLGQIHRIIDLHWASALAVALRKLNKSYGRRTSELKKTRERMSELEAELEDAWREAERAAKEIDELHVALCSDDEGEEAVIETAEIVSIPSSPLTPRPGILPLGGTLMQFESLPLVSPLSPMPRISAISPRSPVAKDDPPPMTPPGQDISETASVRSSKSTKSVRSTKSTRSIRTTDATRLSLVSAAKARSQRTSKGSLRLARGLSRPKTPHEEYPPVPDLPLEFSSTPFPVTSPTASSKFLPSRSASVDCLSMTTVRRRRTSVGDINPPRPSTSSYAPTVTKDDIYVYNHHPHCKRDDLEIRIVPRTLSVRPREQLSEAIPSMWRNVDSVAPKSSVECSESIARKQSSYSKLKTLTKRYSMPFSRFGDRSSIKSRPASSS